MATGKPVWFVLAGILALSVPVIVHAEGDESSEDAPVRKKVRKAKAKPKAKPRAPAAVKPEGPVPYSTLKSSDAPPAQAVTPGPVAHALTPDSLPQPTETNKAMAPASDVAIVPKAALPEPPPVSAMMPPVAPTVGTPAQITLRCETTVTLGNKKISGGTFFIDLFPSAVFPDQTADFKFLFVDPSHKSLIRSSVCLDTLCAANVTNSAYYLVNRVTKKGAALRVTLDRSRGAFYAEEIDQGLFGMFGGKADGDHLGESGTCTPQDLPAKLF